MGYARTWSAASPSAPTRSTPSSIAWPRTVGERTLRLVKWAVQATRKPDDMVRIEIRDDDASLPGSGRVVSFELREASTAV
jgi:hypothetical protein